MDEKERETCVFLSIRRIGRVYPGFHEMRVVFFEKLPVNKKVMCSIEFSELFRVFFCTRIIFFVGIKQGTVPIMRLD